MDRPRWKIIDLMTVILFAAIAFGGGRIFWMPGQTNYEFAFAAYLVVLSTAALGSRFSRGRWRRFWRGYALFGWIFLIFLLHGGFGIHPIYDAQAMARNVPTGMIFGLLGAIAATWFPPPERPGEGNVEPPSEPLAGG